MSEWETIDRDVDQGTLDFICSNCARRVMLYFNGGELDYHRCGCGLEYRTTIARVELQMRGAS